jgi:hypothetical protein
MGTAAMDSALFLLWNCCKKWRITLPDMHRKVKIRTPGNTNNWSLACIIKLGLHVRIGEQPGRRSKPFSKTLTRN